MFHTHARTRCSLMFPAAAEWMVFFVLLLWQWVEVSEGACWSWKLNMLCEVAGFYVADCARTPRGHHQSPQDKLVSKQRMSEVLILTSFTFENKGFHCTSVATFKCYSSSSRLQLLVCIVDPCLQDVSPLLLRSGDVSGHKSRHGSAHFAGRFNHFCMCVCATLLSHITVFTTSAI